MNAPIMNVDVKGIISTALNAKINEIIDHVVVKRKIKNFKPSHIRASTIKKENIIEVHMLYKGDKWLTCTQTMGVNGIEEMTFKSKYIKEVTQN